MHVFQMRITAGQVHVMPMLYVRSYLEALIVIVLRDTAAMASPVLVRSENYNYYGSYFNIDYY